ncbi:AbiTii domain-containing protein [Streptomyces griseosporeus]|uniref:AbiTii domain-containing protein n=1 Tax=Streptomyces griseosporeus TaxID=1910 RepID=UPI0036F61CED
MALLQDVIRDAAGETVSTASLLRQARIVATRLGISEALRWIDAELAGYSDDDVPAYRGPFSVHTFGDFVGPFGSGLRNAPVATSMLPERFTPAGLAKTCILTSVPEMEELLKRGADDGLGVPWTADMVAQFNFHHSRGDFTMYEGMGATRIWQSLSPSLLKSVLDSIRTRILDFALQLEAENPEAGEKAGESLVTPEKGNEIFHTVINGPGANVALNSRNFTQNSYSSPPATDDELIERLRKAGVSEELLTSLVQAIAEDRSEAGGTLAEPGPRTQGWLGRVLALSGRSSEAIGTGVAGGVVTQLVLSYFGLSG